MSHSLLVSISLRQLMPLSHTGRRGTSKEDVQGIVDRTINPVIEEQRNRLDAQEREINDLRKTSHMRCAQTQLTQPPTRLPQPTVQPHKKRPEHGSLQHPKPQPRRQLQHLPDRKEPYTQPKLPVCNSFFSLSSPSTYSYCPDSLNRFAYSRYRTPRSTRNAGCCSIQTVSGP